MNTERFAAAAAAYGADVNRWPEALRGAACLHLAEETTAAAVLAQESALDALLTCSAPPPLDTDARRRAITALMRQRDRREKRGRWLSSVGFCGALGSGIVAGVAFVSLGTAWSSGAAAFEPAHGLYQASIFGDLTTQDEVGPAGTGR